MAKKKDKESAKFVRHFAPLLDATSNSMAKRTLRKNDTTANRGFGPKLWADFEALRNSRVAAKYRHVVPGLIFLKQGN